MSQKTRVLALSLGYGTLGGVGTVTKELTEALNARKDCEVDVLTVWPWRNGNKEKPVEFFGADGSKAQFDNLDGFVNSAQGDRKYDVLHTHSHIFSDAYLQMLDGNHISTNEFFNRYNAPKVLLTHCVVPRESAECGNSADYQTKLEAQKQIMGLSDTIVHLTDEQRHFADTFYEEYSHKTTVIGNGVNPPKSVTEEEVQEFKKNQAPNGEKLCLYLGRISPEKGLQELVEAIPKIKAEQPKFKLLIAGNREPTEYEIRVREQIKRLGLKEGEDYQFLGWVSDEKEKTKIIRAADYTVMPSHYEHFPMAALESMINGTPLIISDVEGPRGIFKLREEKRLALPIQGIRNPQAIADTVIYAIKHEQEVKDIKERAQKEAKDQTWNKIAERYMRLYGELIRNHSNVKQITPKIGIVVPTYNRKGSVDNTIDSLLNQDFQHPYKIAVVDDGSIDGTFEHLLDKYANEIDFAEDQIVGKRRVVSGKEKKIILIRQTNKHVSAARNTGLRTLYNLGCKYFAIQDSGDLALSNRLRTSLEFMEKNPQVDLMHAKSLDIDEEGNILENGPYQRYFQPLWEKARKGSWKKGDINNINYIHNHTIAFTRKVIDALKLDNLYWEGLKYGEDYDFFIKTEKAGLNFGFLDEVVAQSVHHNTSLGLTAEAGIDKLETIVETAMKSKDEGRKRQLYKKAVLKGGLPLIAQKKELFDDYFSVIFQLIVQRNTCIQEGNLSRALTLAQEIIQISPSEENRKQLAQIEHQIAVGSFS